MPEIRITEEDEKKHQVSDRDRRNQELSDIRILLSTEQGMRFFKRFFEKGRMFTSCMTGNSWTFFNCGQRDIVAQYFADCVEADPSKIHALIIRNPEEQNSPVEDSQEE